MKNILLLLCGVFPLFLNAQIQEHFTQSQFPDRPTKWQGHTFAFGVNGDSLLQSQTINPTYISTENQLALGVVWEFGIRLDFNPSPQNQLRVYLIADNDTLTAPLNGYFVQIGENGAADRYHLFRQDGEATTLLLSSTPKHRGDPARVEDRIKVLRDSAGNWELLTAIDGAAIFSSEGTATDNSLTQTSFFGIHCRFTSSNSDKFYFDYFSIDTSSTPITPTVPINVSSVEAPNDTTLRVSFDKLLDDASATDIANYMLNNGYGHPIAASLIDSTVTLIFDTPFIPSSYTLTINNVTDTAGIVIAPNTKISFSHTVPESPETKLLPDDTDGAWFYDDFNTGPLQDHWQGGVASFEIIDKRVRINDATTSPIFLSTPSNRLVNTVWEAGVQVDGTLSSGNYVRLYLTSTNDSLLGPHQGYHLQIDGSGGNHVYHLWRQNGSSRSRIFQSDPIPNQHGKFRARVRVTRDSEANWHIFADEYDSGTFQPILRNNGDSTTIDGTHTTSGYTGYFVNFTPTRRGAYKLDYLLIKQLDDIIEVPKPLAITTIDVPNDTTLTIAFNRLLDEERATVVVNYTLDNGYNHPYSASLMDSIVTLVFSASFVSSNYTLTVNNVTDTAGTAIAPNTKVPFSYTASESPETKLLPDDTDGASFYDDFNSTSLPSYWRGNTTFFEILDRRVRINDFAMSPASLSTSSNRLVNTVWETGIQVDGALSANNYVRLYLSSTNDSLRGPQQGYHLQIDGSGGNHVYHLWRQNGASRSRIFQSNPIPNQLGKFRARVRVTRDSEANWRIFADEYDSGIFQPVLSINGDSIVINNAHTIAGHTGYSVNFTPTRRGDYKLDYLLIKPLDPSADPVPDDIPPKIVSASFTDSLSLRITYDKPVDPISATDASNYLLNSVNPGSIEIVAREATLLFSNSFATGEYTLSVGNIKNQDGFAMEADTILVLHYTKLHTIQPNDILINEILSYPKPDGVDFVEVYNHSNKIVDLQQLYVASVNTTSHVVGSLRKVSDEQHLFYPGEYKVLTTNPDIVKQHYPEALLNTFIDMAALPNFNNETGGVILSSNGLTIDSLYYTPAMQSLFISNHRGVSLERQSFSNSTLAPGNFRSAATSVGGATPGYLNSQGEVEASGDNIFLVSKTFSPDNDGFEDFLEINYHFSKSGNMANIDIYNDKGQLVKRLQRNQSMATQGVITWDGLSDTNQRLPVGIYIALIEIYNAQGMRNVYRKGFVLAAKL